MKTSWLLYRVQPDTTETSRYIYRLCAHTATQRLLQHSTRCNDRIEGAHLQEEGELGVTVRNVMWLLPSNSLLLRKGVDHTTEDAETLVDVGSLAEAVTTCPRRLLLLTASQVHQVEAAGEHCRDAIVDLFAANDAGEHTVRSARLAVHARLSNVPVPRALVQQLEHVCHCTEEALLRLQSMLQTGLSSSTG